MLSYHLAWMSRGFSLRPDGLAIGQDLAVTREQYGVEEEGAEHAAQLLPLLIFQICTGLEPAW